MAQRLIAYGPKGQHSTARAEASAASEGLGYGFPKRWQARKGRNGAVAALQCHTLPNRRSQISPDYDGSDWTPEEMLALAARAFDDADNAEPIPAHLSEDDAEDLALSRSAEYNEILRRSQESLERDRAHQQ